MKKSFAILSAVSIAATASVALAGHPAPGYASAFQRVRMGAQVIARKTRSILENVRADHHHRSRIWYRGYAVSSLRQLSRAAQHFLRHGMDANREHLGRDFRKLESRFHQAQRVLFWLHPSPMLQADFAEVARCIAMMGPIVRKLVTTPVTYYPLPPRAAPPGTYTPDPQPATVTYTPYAQPATSVSVAPGLPVPTVSSYQTY
jgi:hypothetical protein